MFLYYEKLNPLRKRAKIPEKNEKNHESKY